MRPPRGLRAGVPRPQDACASRPWPKQPETALSLPSSQGCPARAAAAKQLSRASRGSRTCRPSTPRAGSRPCPPNTVTPWPPGRARNRSTGGKGGGAAWTPSRSAAREASRPNCVRRTDCRIPSNTSSRLRRLLKKKLKLESRSSWSTFWSRAGQGGRILLYHILVRKRWKRRRRLP